MRALREHLGFVGLLLVPPLVFAGCLAGLIAFLAVVHAMAPFFFMGFMGWMLWQIVGRKPLERERQQRELKEERQRTNLLIQTHLAAHRLMDTPQNRWHVLQLLSKPAGRGRGR